MNRLKETFQLWFHPDRQQETEHGGSSVCHHGNQGKEVDVRVLANSYAEQELNRSALHMFKTALPCGL